LYETPGGALYGKFKYDSIPLKDISLDVRNPRIVTQAPLKYQEEILQYLLENEDLADFIKKIASEGKNIGAERPYVIQSGPGYTVIEGNSRIAAYKVLTGLLKVPGEYANAVPEIPKDAIESLLSVEYRADS
jgi:hypothetical protein